MKNRWIYACLALILWACNSSNNDSAASQREVAASTRQNDEGKKLFYGRCASCHMVNKEMTGPALKGVENRWNDSAKLYAFIRNSDSLIKTDEYSKKLWQQYNQTAMPAHPDMTDGQIRQVLDYVNAVSQ